MKLKITSTEIKSRTVNRKRDGKAFTFREQAVQVFFQSGEVRLIAVSLDDGQQAFPPGEYTILPSSFYVDRNNRLALGRLHLAPLVAEARKSA